MKKGKAKTENMIRMLRVNEGMCVDDIYREYGISAPTYCLWKKRYGGLSVKGAQRLKELENEAAQLKKIVADQLLQIKALEILLKKSLSPDR